MVESVVNAIMNQMEKEEVLSVETKEHYEYALIIMIEKWITIVSILFISVLLGKSVPMFLFLGFFLTLRKRTGGFHANSFLQCYIGSLIISVATIFLCSVVEYNMGVLYAMLFCAIVMIVVVGTINHPDLALDEYELHESKRAARNMLCLESMILFAAITLDIRHIYICYMSMAIILCAILMCVAKILKQEVGTWERKN